MNTTSALEKRIAVALSSNITAANLASLIAETETAIAAADEVAEAEREKALDPALSPDAKALVAGSRRRPRYTGVTGARAAEREA
jgi:hypothetical protein